jgi:mRNA interferase RelE/StbE
MKVLFERSFLSDVLAIPDKQTRDRLAKTINHLKTIKTLSEIPNLKKLKGHASAFRIKLGNYRLGFFLEGNTLILVRFQDRKDIYRQFPG